MKIDWFDSEKYFFTDESVKSQITDSISENLTDSDLESRVNYFEQQIIYSNSKSKKQINYIIHTISKR